MSLPNKRIPIKLALSLPSYDGRRVNAIPMLTVGQAVGTIHYMTAQGSLLAHVFNRTLCEARQKRDAGVATHFCMLHDDIAPETDWFQKLWAEYIKPEEGKRGVISVVSPIKSPHMMSSTALDTDPWEPRKLTLEEVSRLPVTFGARDATAVASVPAHCSLLVNTGLMLFDLREPWVDGLVFSIRDFIQVKDGVPKAFVEPEDWRMSRYIHSQGYPVRATRAVELAHYGSLGWTNQWQTDEAAAPASSTAATAEVKS